MERPQKGILTRACTAAIVVAAACTLAASGRPSTRPPALSPPNATATPAHRPAAGAAGPAVQATAAVAVPAGETVTISSTGSGSQGEIVPDPSVSIVGVESFGSSQSLTANSAVQLGSGFVVSSDGTAAWVATARHVLSGNAAAVFLPGSSTPHLVDQIVKDQSADVALLHVPYLPGVAAVTLGTAPESAWAAEVACVRFPEWTYQAYPISLQASGGASLPDGAVLLQTPSLSVLPGCSGGPLTVYSTKPGRTAVVTGLVVDATTDPTGVGYVPADTLESLIASQANSGGSD